MCVFFVCLTPLELRSMKPSASFLLFMFVFPEIGRACYRGETQYVMNEWVNEWCLETLDLKPRSTDLQSVVPSLYSAWYPCNPAIITLNSVPQVGNGKNSLFLIWGKLQIHLEKEIATHSSVLAWRIPGTKEPGGLPSMGLHRVRHDWSDLAAAAAGTLSCVVLKGIVSCTNSLGC